MLWTSSATTGSPGSGGSNPSPPNNRAHTYIFIKITVSSSSSAWLAQLQWVQWKHGYVRPLPGSGHTHSFSNRHLPHAKLLQPTTTADRTFQMGGGKMLLHPGVCRGLLAVPGLVLPTLIRSGSSVMLTFPSHLLPCPFPPWLCRFGFCAKSQFWSYEAMKRPHLGIRAASCFGSDANCTALLQRCVSWRDGGCFHYVPPAARRGIPSPHCRS